MRLVLSLSLFALVGCSSSPSTSTSTDLDATASESGIAPDGGAPPDAGGDSLVSTFAFMGCNRIQKADWDPVADPASANMAQLQQTFIDVAALGDVPKYFFFVGDMVLGLKDSTTLSGQLDAWAKVYAASPIASKLTLVPAPGNHEMLTKANKVETPNAGSDAVWVKWTAANGFDKQAGNGPVNGGANQDALQDDQSRISYSFDDGDTHYVVLNTDTWTTTPDSSSGSTQIGWVALRWLISDLQTAEANGKIRRTYIFGHKPLVPPMGVTGADATINAALVPAMEALLDTSAKVKGYFCAHAHQWDDQKLPGKRGVHQVIAGNAGSALESGWTTPYYGFTVVRTYASGKVGVVSYQRPVPTPYNAAVTVAATKMDELVIAP